MMQSYRRLHVLSSDRSAQNSEVPHIEWFCEPRIRYVSKVRATRKLVVGGNLWLLHL
jgi:hypothetical protein